MTVWNNDTVRQLERSSIRSFMERNRRYLCGRVMDFGSGKEPYKDLVDGTYVPIEQGMTCSGEFDAVMCNQVFQYLHRPLTILETFHTLLVNKQGTLVLTYPTCWDEVEATDLWRFTKMGMERLLSLSKFHVLCHERRAEIDLNGFKFPLGYGVVAKAN